MPLFGPPNVKKLKAKGNVKGLIKALGYDKDRLAVCRRDGFPPNSIHGKIAAI